MAAVIKLYRYSFKKFCFYLDTFTQINVFNPYKHLGLYFYPHFTNEETKTQSYRTS